MPFQLKRAYDEPAPDDGRRILVDRLWPRGVKKEVLKLDKWMKEIAPSTELRKRYHGKTGAFEEFKMRYFDELKQKDELVEQLLEQGRNRTVTLIYAAKDREQNNAVALSEYLQTLQNEDS